MIYEKQNIPYLKIPDMGSQLFISYPTLDVLHDMVRTRTLGEEHKYEVIEVLSAYMHQGLPEAFYLASTYGDRVFGEKKHIELLMEASDLDYPPACYKLGAFYDFGDWGLNVDKERAISLIMRAAELGHSHSKWIVGSDKIYGTAFMVQDVNSGVELVVEAAAEKSKEALETLANFHSKGEFGFPKDAVISQKYRSMKEDPNCVDE